MTVGILAALGMSTGAVADTVSPRWAIALPPDGHWGLVAPSGYPSMTADNLPQDPHRIYRPSGLLHHLSSGVPFGPEPALARDGSGYAYRTASGVVVVDAIDAQGSIRWSWPLPAGTDPTALAVGSEGDAYVGLSSSTVGRVVRLRWADAAEAFSVALPGDSRWVFGFVRQASGVAAIGPQGVYFVTREGVLSAPVTAPGGGAYDIAGNASGDVFLTTYEPPPGPCGFGSGANRISRITAAGMLAWSIGLGGCASLFTLAPLPDGGVAMRRWVGEPGQQRFTVYNRDGTVRWQSEFDSADDRLMAGPLVDSDGNIYTYSRLSGQPCANGPAECWGFAVSRREAAAAPVTDRVVVVDDDYNDRQVHDCGEFQIARGQFYVFYGTSPDFFACWPREVQLRAYSVEGMADQYPRAPGTIPAPPDVPEEPPAPPEPPEADEKARRATAPVATTMGPPATTTSGDTTKPVLSALHLSPRTFHSVRAGVHATGQRGSTVSYELSETATVTFKVEQALRGRVVDGHCVKVTLARRGAHPCTRYGILRGSFTRAGRRGANTFRFDTRVGGHTLRTGRYRLRARATDEAGNRSALRRSAFRIVRQ